ncbi:M14 family metallopeptidase [Alteromonas gilva]|uniref:M14 family metallopeptidase n=1 Tax=Alteromonas gilva TaxID=2987522 RepID=A0ABT5KX26_9ALTE|nr:M14 family metallopeptidase [Alteromonas gilva]MDC8829310.1 M14 family metallopeptidase [Alteromonas gilva]
MLLATLRVSLKQLKHGITLSSQTMLKRASLLIGTLVISGACLAQGKPATHYLPADTELDSAIPTPESVLGYNVGEWHVRHDLLVNYMRALAEASDRVSLEVTGYTHEQRPLMLLTITAPDNRAKLDGWRADHLKQVNQGDKTSADAPLFLYMGYSVHGNEPSGANASLLVAYYLAAAKDERVTELLANNVVLLDPSFNPDGLSRFAQWANMHKGQVLSSDPDHREHREGWPNGRTNHYWFDLNRDWLMLVHPESQARISKFQQWRPHILTDFHEMGTNSTYFFQPGVPSRKNPWTPEGNVRLTNALAESYVKAFDSQNQLYFSQEGFDDFYYGKGSTYPDAQGSVGILFEQASSRGHLQDSINGPLSFVKTIQNQFTISLAVFDGALANKAALLDYQHNFFRDTAALAKEDEHAAYFLHEPLDSWRLDKAKWVLDQHHIDYQIPAADMTVDNNTLGADNTLVIPLAQPQYRLIKSLFSTRQTFTDNTFYDVSNWNLPLAFDLEYGALNARDLRRVKLAKATTTEPAALPAIHADAYAYAFEWHHFKSPALLQNLAAASVDARIATEGFSAKTHDGERAFSAGTIVIPQGVPQPPQLAALLNSAVQQTGVPVYSLTSGFTSSGLDLGSRGMVPVKAPKVLVVGGEGTSPYQVGEIWHYLDTQVGMPITLVEQDNLARTSLSQYTHIVVASGRYNLADSLVNDITDWVKQGGTLIGQTSALYLFEKEKWLDIDVSSSDDVQDLFSQKSLKYGDRSAYNAQQLIAGSVYKTRIDTSHPLFYGYDSDELNMFKTSNMMVTSNESPFEIPARYVESPLVAGYSASVLASEIGGSVAVIAEPMGRGRVIGFTDDPQFRGFWYGTSKLMSNALFMSEAID